MKVKITINAGLLRGPNENRFVADCEPGTIGEYLGPHPIQELANVGWHGVRVRGLYAPLHESQFEEIDS